MAAVVHSAGIQDRDGAKLVLKEMVDRFPRLKKILADGIYNGDIADWEKEHGQIPQAAVVVTRTGWESRWNSPKTYRNAEPKGTLHFPGYSQDAARFLVEGRNVIGLGIDTLSIDYGPSKDFPVHKYTLSHSLYHLENVANLAHVPPSGATLLVAPIKLEGGSGGPVRILALIK